MKKAHGYYLDIDGKEVGRVTLHESGNHVSIFESIRGNLFDGSICDPRITEIMTAEKNSLDTLASLYGGTAKVVAFGYYRQYQPDGITPNT